MSLSGKRILVTRSRRQASELARRLEEAGAEVILIPTIEIAPPASFCALDAALASIRSFDWVLFTSANAVVAFALRARRLGLAPSAKKVAVVGPATAQAAREIGLAVDLIPSEYVADSLAEALLPHAPGASMLLVRAETARDFLPEALSAAGATVTIATAYRTVVPEESIAALRHLFSDPTRYPDAITFTSSSTVTNLLALMEAGGLALPAKVARASIGPVTSRTLQETGQPATVEAAEATLPSLCDALKTYFTS